MIDLPRDAPTGLPWFVLWASIGGLFLFLNKQFDKDEEILSAELSEQSKRSLERLNELLARRFTRSRQEGDPSLVDDGSLDEVHHLVRKAWLARSSLSFLIRMARLVRIFSVLQIAAAIPAAGVWWMFEGLRDPTAWLVGGIVFLLPAFICLAIQVVGMFRWTVKRS